MTAPLRLGSLCSGYEGLGMAVASVLDVELTWVADPDPGAAAILAHHWPDVPNLLDITAVDWTAVPPVDVICGGYPCQPFSLAGKRKGSADARHLWPYIARALRVLRPRLAIFENVDHHLRLGFDTVLADLADLGFDAEWCLVRADEVGAAHRRNRLIFIAWPADTDHIGDDRPTTEHRPDGREVAARDAAADPARDGRDERRPEPTGILRRPDAALSRDADADAAGLGGQDESGHDRPPVVLTEPGAGRGNLPGRDAEGAGRPAGGSGVVGWGPYAPAIDRWARILGRPAPHPRLPTGPAGGDQLNPVFVEWLMGLPEGHVTASAIWEAFTEAARTRRARVTPATLRNAQLRALGNGVVPQQGAAGLAHLLDRMKAAA